MKLGFRCLFASCHTHYPGTMQGDVKTHFDHCTATYNQLHALATIPGFSGFCGVLKEVLLTTSSHASI